MKHQTSDGHTAPASFASLLSPLAEPSEQELQRLRCQLLEVAESGREALLLEVAEGAEWLAAMVDLALCGELSKTGQSNTMLLGDLRDGIQMLDDLISGRSASPREWENRIEQLRGKWGEYLDLVNGSIRTSLADGAWAAANATQAGNAVATEPWSVDGTDQQIELLLSAVAQSAAAAEPQPPQVVSNATLAKQPLHVKPTCPLAQNADQELLEAYLDDSQRCIASMEQVILALSSGPQQAAQLRQLCRELHTLKGASASVGFHQLAQQLHELEDVLEAAQKGDANAPDRQMLLGEIDSFRKQIEQLTGFAVNSETAATPATAVQRTSAEHPATHNEETLRVKASQVDRLMDMLAELVMLRNRRDSRVEQLKDVHGQLLQFVSRLRGWHAVNENRLGSADPSASSKPQANIVESLGQAANELLYLGRKLRDLFEPMAEEQRGISRFIGQFRQELTELRRLPVAGLFQRLQRAVHDAAQSDDKRVRLQFSGEQTGLERSLQERLYEPLLHVVRNAVSHGIESAADRMACGKDPVGTITLEARGGTNLLSVSVRDDGRGLNYDALRRRGLELGLLESDRSASPEELAQLIFRPGFSTRESTSQVSGRGVGMDVVASTLERMHGWVEVESTPGQGTQIRLLIPRRSVIEHAMIFRAAGQLLALPMQFVNEVAPQSAVSNGNVRCGAEELHPIHFSRLFSNDMVQSSGHRVLVLASSGQTMSSRRAGRSRVAILVDDVVGPQEVVVRPLPLLLRGHPILSGVSLSATGEIVLLLDSQRLFDWAITRVEEHTVNEAQPASLPALVVDDSSAARKRVVRALRERGLPSEEAENGLEALERLRRSAYSTVWLDLEMPRMDGFELLEALRREPVVNAAPVVIVSSRCDSATRERAAQLGAAEFLAKPATDQDVDRVLEILSVSNCGRK